MTLEPPWVYGPVVHPVISKKHPPKVERGEDEEE